MYVIVVNVDVGVFPFTVVPGKDFLLCGTMALFFLACVQKRFALSHHEYFQRPQG